MGDLKAEDKALIEGEFGVVPLWVVEHPKSVSRLIDRAREGGRQSRLMKTFRLKPDPSGEEEHSATGEPTRHPKPSQQAVERVENLAMALEYHAENEIGSLELVSRKNAGPLAADLRALLASFSGDRG